MIHAHELRIGNKLLRDGIVVTIDARSIFDIWEKSDKYEPIPLTPELLERYGFEKSSIADNAGSWDYYYLDFKRDREDNVRTRCFLIEYPELSNTWGFGCERIDDNAKVCISNIKNLHQLQNLHFALTGQELTITQTT